MENKNKLGMKAKLIIIAVVVILAALIAIRLTGGEEEVETTPLSTVSVTAPETGDIAVESSLIGTVEPGDVYYVIPKAAGEITEIFVNAGDKVNEGDPICSIDISKQIESAEIQLQTAREAETLAKTNLDRMNTLYATGDISKQSLESTQNSYDQASAAVKSAQLQYDTYVEYATVTAPVSGVVESTNMSINAMASQSEQVCVISSDGANKLTFSIPDRLLSELHTGDTIRVSKQGSEYEGRITSIETLVNSQTGLYPVEAEFDGSDAVAKGARVKVYFDAESAEDTMLVDTDCIYYDGGKTYIYTISYNDESSEAEEGNTGESGESTALEGNRTATIHKNEVETGISNSEKTEILSGIDMDSIVVRTWTSQLYEGAQVQVLPAEG